MATLITHTFNEQYLMQWFVPHHAKVFDHAIVLDYASTDNTVDVIHELAPNWEIRQSRNEFFRASEIDEEVMDVERAISGWKMTLTATEFMCGDVTALTERLAIQGHAAAHIRPVAMVDLKKRDFANEKMPLDEQCHHGYLGGWITPYKSRLLHCHADGAYSVGRHSTAHTDVTWNPEGALLKWYGFAPWTPQLRDRKMQIQSRIPPDDVAVGRGYQHMVDESRLKEMWQSEVAISTDLRDIPEYF